MKPSLVAGLTWESIKRKMVEENLYNKVYKYQYSDSDEYTREVTLEDGEKIVVKLLHSEELEADFLSILGGLFSVELYSSLNDFYSRFYFGVYPEIPEEGNPIPDALCYMFTEVLGNGNWYKKSSSVTEIYTIDGRAYPKLYVCCFLAALNKTGGVATATVGVRNIDVFFRLEV